MAAQILPLIDQAQTVLGVDRLQQQGAYRDATLGIREQALQAREAQAQQLNQYRSQLIQSEFQRQQDALQHNADVLGMKIPQAQAEYQGKLIENQLKGQELKNNPIKTLLSNADTNSQISARDQSTDTSAYNLATKKLFDSRAEAQRMTNMLMGKGVHTDEEVGQLGKLSDEHSAAVQALADRKTTQMTLITEQPKAVRGALLAPWLQSGAISAAEAKAILVAPTKNHEIEDALEEKFGHAEMLHYQGLKQVIDSGKGGGVMTQMDSTVSNAIKQQAAIIEKLHQREKEDEAQISTLKKGTSFMGSSVEDLKNINGEFYVKTSDGKVYNSSKNPVDPKTLKEIK